MRLCVIMVSLFLMAGCGDNPGAAFQRMGFTEETVLAGRLMDQSGDGHWRALSREEIEVIVREMKFIRSARTAVVEPRYRIELFTNEVEDQASLQVFVDTTGEGYFRKVPGREIMFYSGNFPEVLQALGISTNR